MLIKTIEMKDYGIITIATVAQRTEPNHKSEMINQLLLGDRLIIEEVKNDWIKAINYFDNYSGWINHKQCSLLTKAEFETLQNCPKFTSKNLFEKIEINHKQTFYITTGCTIYKHNDIFIIAPKMNITNTIPLENIDVKQKHLICEKAKLFLNSPYLWGGRNPMGIDCSGFVQIVFMLCGITLPRDAAQQVNCGEEVAFVNEVKAGDLAFFENETGHITHVGILLSQQEIIHASGKVKIDKFDHYGIFCNETNKYSHKLRIIKRI